MSNSPYRSAGNTSAGNTHQNGGITIGYGPRATFITKADGIKPVLNEGRTLVPNVPLSNRTILQTTTVMDTQVVYPALVLVEDPRLDVGSDTIATGKAVQSNISISYDNVSLIEFTPTNPVNSNSYGNGPSGLPDFYGTNKPALGFSGIVNGMFSVMQDTAPLGVNKRYPFSSFTTWDIFVVARSPQPQNEMGIFGITDGGNNHAMVGMHYNMPYISTYQTIITGGHSRIWGSGVSLVANTTYLLHFYGDSSSYGMRVNNQEVTVISSGSANISPNNGKFFNSTSLWQSANWAALCFGGNGGGGSPIYYNGLLGSVRLYQGLTSANRNTVASSIASNFGITLLA